MTKFIINDLVTYVPDQHRLIPTGKKGSETVLNIPASRCLQLLLLRPGKVISQQEFFKFAWQNQGQYVTTNTFYQNISLLRKGLVSAGIKEDIIRTVPKEGLIFSGNVLILESENVKAGTEERLNDKPAIDVVNEEETEVKEENKQPSITPPPVQPETKAKKIKGSLLKLRKKIMFLNPMLVLFSAMALVYLVSEHARSRTFLVSHVRIPDVNQCTVYINKSELNLTSDGYLRFLKSKNVVCRPNQFIYITDGQRGSSKVVQRCENGSSEDPECETLYPLDPEVIAPVPPPMKR